MRGGFFLECCYKTENLTSQNNKEIHNGCTKMQKNVLLQAALKDFDHLLT